MDGRFGQKGLNDVKKTRPPHKPGKALSRHPFAGHMGSCRAEPSYRRPMSALDRFTDSSRTSRHVRKVPTAEIAHSITSSAKASSFAGISMPIVLAVLRLMTNSNFVGCKMGKSAGFAPFKILPT
jgi:hypothetical protein